jgi:hypothetical protein
MGIFILQHIIASTGRATNVRENERANRWCQRERADIQTQRTTSQNQMMACPVLLQIHHQIPTGIPLASTNSRQERKHVAANVR